MQITYRLMTIEDYKSVFALWSECVGLELTDDDQQERIAIYLFRNLKTCFVAMQNERTIASVLCGHDGRRAILRHLAVNPNYRGLGIARELIQRCFVALQLEGIQKCNLFVLDSNPAGLEFWGHLGWFPLADNFTTWQHATKLKV